MRSGLRDSSGGVERAARNPFRDRAHRRTQPRRAAHYRSELHAHAEGPVQIERRPRAAPRAPPARAAACAPPPRPPARLPTRPAAPPPAAPPPPRARRPGPAPPAVAAAEARHSGYFAGLGEKRAVAGACVEID